MALHPDTASNLAGQFGAIKGSADYTAGKTDKVSGISVLDDYTILARHGDAQWHLHDSDGAVPTPREFAIVPKHLLGSAQTGGPGQKLHSSPPRPWAPALSNSQLRDRQFVEMEANPDYHFGKPTIDKLLFNIVQSPDAMSVAMDRGEIDMPLFDRAPHRRTCTASSSQIRSSRSSALADGPVIGYGFNFRKDGIKDPRLHQAWLYALDRQTLNQQFNLGAGRIVNSWMIHQWYQKPEWNDLYQFNPDQARYFSAIWVGTPVGSSM